MILTQEIICKKNRKQKGKQNFADILTYEPEKPEEKKLGNLYIAIELLNVSPDIGHITNLITSIIKREYYSKPDRSPLESLEGGLKKANSLILELIHKMDDNDAKEWIDKLNCICATICHDAIYLTKTGKFKALLYRNEKLINIDQKLDNPMTKTNALKTFQGIVSGKIELNDKIIFISSKILSDADNDKLEKIFQTGNISENRAQIKETLLDPSHSDMATTIFLIEITEDPVCENLENSEYITPPISLSEIIVPTA